MVVRPLDQDVDLFRDGLQVVVHTLNDGDEPDDRWFQLTLSFIKRIYQVLMPNEFLTKLPFNVIYVGNGARLYGVQPAEEGNACYDNGEYPTGNLIQLLHDALPNGDTTLREQPFRIGLVRRLIAGTPVIRYA